MNPDKTFGATALQLLHEARIPGVALDKALEFRRVAEALATGQAIIVAAQPMPEPPTDLPETAQ